MKLFFTLIFTIVLFSLVFAQAPQKMSYQAVIRDASNKLVVNKQVGMKISILQGTATGSIVYTETQKPTTNANGLVSIEIGGGTNFATIDWSNGPYFIETSTDPSGGNNYTITGTSQFLSVPYAIHSQTAQQLIGSIKENQISDLKRFTNNDETDPIFHSSVAQGITASDTANWNKKSDFNGNYDALTNKPVIPLKLSELNNDAGFITNPNDDDASPINEIQILSIINDTIYLTQGGFVKLPASFSGNYSDLKDKPTNLSQFTNDAGYQLKSEDGDTNPENELQRLYFTPEKRIGLTNGGYVDMVDVEADPKFNASPAKGITSTNIGNWNTTYGWGNHATAGYLTSYNEADPKYTADSSFVKTGIRDWYGSLAKSIDTADTTWWGRTETDPLFTIWDKQTGISITESQISDLAHFTNADEIDPVFTSSLAGHITASDTIRWGYNKWKVSGDDLYYSVGKVGIGITTPEDIGSAPLNVEGGILYKGGLTGGATPGKIYYDPTGTGTFKYFDNNNVEQVLGVGSINYTGTLWQNVNSDYVANTDAVVIGSLAVGFDAVAGESFGFATILLKENNLRIKFDDTSLTAGFPANDWQLTANESASGGANYFAIEDLTGAKIPFKVMAGANTDALYISSNSNLGINTSSPILDVHIKTGDTPGIRFEQVDGGWTPQTWDVAANEANFFVRDVTNGSLLPFRIRPGAPTSSIDISSTGNVGIGTAAPARKLHVNDAMRLQPTTEPASAEAGDLYFDSAISKLRCYDGTQWHNLW
jgi:hypothetical protein